MASGVNKVILVGNLGADPEARHGSSGTMVVRVNLATTKRWTNRETNQQQEATQWHRLVFFRRHAEIASQYLKKGSKVYVEGELNYSQYEKDGQTRYSTEIIVREMQMLDGRSDGGTYTADPPKAANASPTDTAPAQQPAGDNQWKDDDIPF